MILQNKLKKENKVPEQIKDKNNFPTKNFEIKLYVI